MRLVDTSAWIEHLLDSGTGQKVAALLPDRSEWLAPTIVQLEIAKWLTREVGEEAADQVIAFSQLCQVVPLDTELALSAANLCRRYRLATADAVIYATALKYEAELLTCDAHFDGLAGVIFLAKVD